MLFSPAHMGQLDLTGLEDKAAMSIRERMVSGLMNVAAELAEPVAAGLGIRELPAPMPKLNACGIDTRLPDGQPDPGLIVAADAAAVAKDFMTAMAKHRHFARETDPPRV